MALLKVTVLLCVVAAAYAAPRQANEDSEVEPYVWTEGCWKDAYSRGVGTIPDACPNSEKDGLLCYPYCRDGYDGVGPVCWQNCPSGWRDDGAFCYKPDSYGRGVGYISESLCRQHYPSCENYWGLWYQKCAAGFYAFGCCVCSPVCPSGMTDIGISCAKHSYGRGVGEVMKCAETLEYDTGLCYPMCQAKYDGVGPLCWSVCPKRIWKNDCGALCLNDETLCDDKVRQLIADAIDVFMQAWKLLQNPTEEEFKKLLKETLNAVTGYAYPYCNKR